MIAPGTGTGLASPRFDARCRFLARYCFDDGAGMQLCIAAGGEERRANLVAKERRWDGELPHHLFSVLALTTAQWHGSRAGQRRRTDASATSRMRAHAPDPDDTHNPPDPWRFERLSLTPGEQSEVAEDELGMNSDVWL